MLTDCGNIIDLDSLPAYRPPKEAMTKEEWFRELETRPATANQVGRIMNKFQSLGFRDNDRKQRLDIISALTGRDLDSTWELTQGEAGKLVKALRNVQTLDDLYDLLPVEYWDDETEEAGYLSPLASLFARIRQAMKTWLT